LTLPHPRSALARLVPPLSRCPHYPLPCNPCLRTSVTYLSGLYTRAKGRLPLSRATGVAERRVRGEGQQSAANRLTPFARAPHSPSLAVAGSAPYNSRGKATHKE